MGPNHRLAIAAFVAAAVAGGGTVAVAKFVRGDTAQKANAAAVRLAQPVVSTLKAAPKHLDRVTGGLRQAKDVLQQHSPAREVQRATQAMSGSGGGAAAPRGHAAAAHAPQWERQPLGRGVIIERR